MKICLTLHTFLLVTSMLALSSVTRGEEPLLMPFPPALTAPPQETHLSSPILSSATFSSSVMNNVFSQPPALTGRYTVNGSTVMPYIGLGFGGGETNDVNRTVTRQSALQNSVQQDRLLNDVLGKSIIPNEFQVGIRIPF